jgi:hypothetical protein
MDPCLITRNDSADTAVALYRITLWELDKGHHSCHFVAIYYSTRYPLADLTDL